MWCCSDSNLKHAKYRKSVFDRKQIDSLKRKFNFVSGNQQYITRQTFKKNIGYLGIRSVTSFLDRIFNSFDIDQDNKISFDDFIEYMQILKDGTDDQKAQISFNLIYIDNDNLEQKKRKSSFSKNDLQKQQKPKKKKKIIDMKMFQKFFEDFYKSWSSITNESIPKQTRLALKKFIQQLFIKVQNDGRNAIDLEYYKQLYKDRQFMMAFRQINSRLGIFSILSQAFIQTVEGFPGTTSSRKNVRNKHEQTEISIANTHQQNDQTLDKYFYDAKRYQIDNIFDENVEQSGDEFLKVMQLNSNNQKQKTFVKDKQKISHQTSGNRLKAKDDDFLKVENLNSNNVYKKSKDQPLKISNMISQNLTNPRSPKFTSSYQNTKETDQGTEYQERLEEHVAFLERKILFLQSKLKQVIDESKQIYNQMHQQFLKILQRIQKQQQMKQKQDSDFNHEAEEKKLLVQKNKPNNKKVFFGDKNFNLVLQIMVGIQMSVRSVSGFQQIIFEEPEDFHLKHTFEMDYGHFGENDILYTFTDYAPNVFNHIRKIYEIDNQHYINSIGPNKMMSSLIMGKMASFEELMSEGKSGSFFYHTEDGKYLIKTISQRQFYFMRKILEKYFRHIKTNPQTLMPRFFGLHKITSVKRENFNSEKIIYYLIVMNNFFNLNNSHDKIIDKYDLKGSWIGRKSLTGVKKDVNFKQQNRFIDIDIDEKLKIYQILENDAEFFSQNNVIDYSMLLGIVQSQQLKKKRLTKTYSLFNIETVEPLPSQHALHILEQKKSMNFKFKSDNKSSESYLIGIIDILTEYNSRKQAQHFFKGCIHDRAGISAVPPQQYKKRFLDFMKTEVFRLNDAPRSKSRETKHLRNYNQQFKTEENQLRIKQQRYNIYSSNNKIVGKSKF